MNIIETKNLQKIIKRKEILHDITMHVPENSIYGLLGPNGAGKSTLLKLLTNVWKPTSGQILFENNILDKADLKQVGALIEEPAIYPNLTAYENLKIISLLLNTDTNRIDEVLSLVDLKNKDIDKKLVKNFSVGMKQRLGIGIALMNNPKLLILDEPTNGLDPLGIQDLREFILSLPQKGISVILSSHLLSEVQQVADNVGIIVNGSLRYENTNDKSDDKSLEEKFMQVLKMEGRTID